jgi:hypothetical protein
MRQPAPLASELNSELGTRDSDGVPPIVHEVLRSPGQPLDPVTRAFMEPRFGHDFSKIRAHKDNRAGGLRANEQVAPATIPMSQWEATGISGDVPFTVDFPAPPLLTLPFNIPKPAAPPVPPPGPAPKAP